MTGFVQAQSVERNRITFSAGWARQLYVFPTQRQTAPVLGISYGFRPLKWVELESGLFGALQPGQELCSAHGCFNPNDRYLWVPFGLRFVAPIAWRRLELSAGGGGLYEKYWVSNGPNNPFNVHSRDGWGGYFVGGADVALDHRRRFWAGAAPRVLLVNPPFSRDRWFTITGDVSFRF